VSFITLDFIMGFAFYRVGEGVPFAAAYSGEERYLFKALIM